MKIVIGDTFSIETLSRNCILHYCYFSEASGYLVRVFVLRKDVLFKDVENIINGDEDFNVFFFLKQALKAKSVLRIGNYGLPNTFSLPLSMRDESVFDSAPFKWRIVPLNPTKVQYSVKELTEEQIKLSPYQIWSDKVFIEKIDSGFSLQAWR